MPLPFLLFSCEHASKALPRSYKNLGLSKRVLSSHIAWDLGAGFVTKQIAQAFSCQPFLGQYSRLLIDLNRSEHHAKLIPSRSFGKLIPGNRILSSAQKHARLQRYYRPYRAAILAAIRSGITTYGKSLHFSIHSFTPIMTGQKRRADIGLLYDPQCPWEGEVVSQLMHGLRAAGFHVRKNYPYRGTSDGLTSYCRRLFASPEYVGVEIEINQHLLAKKQSTRRVICHLVQGLAAMIL